MPQYLLASELRSLLVCYPPSSPQFPSKAPVDTCRLTVGLFNISLRSQLLPQPNFVHLIREDSIAILAAKGRQHARIPKQRRSGFGTNITQGKPVLGHPIEMSREGARGRCIIILCLCCARPIVRLVGIICAMVFKFSSSPKWGLRCDGLA